MPKACHHRGEIKDNKPLRLFSYLRLMSEIFWLTREHLFLIGAPEEGRGQAASCLVKEVLAAEVKVHCITQVLLFAMTMNPHQDSAKWAGAVSVMLFMSVLCFWHLQSVFKYLVFKMQESREGKGLLSCRSAPKHVRQQDVQAAGSCHIPLEEPS